MGSRFMHLLISDFVCKELSIKQRGEMLLGAIAPDAKSEKNDTHFVGDRFKFGVNRRWEYGRFIMKYKERITEPFMLGYLTHLVADEVWAMKSFFSGFEERLKNDPTLYERYHHDFRLCNAKLNDKYASDGLYEALNSAVYIPSIEELDEKNILELKQHALNDFNYPIDHIEQELSIFSFEEILAYLERSAYRALDVCRPLFVTGILRCTHIPFLTNNPFNHVTEGVFVVRVFPFVFPVKEATYKVIGDRTLKFYIFEPGTPPKDRTAILFFIGGSFGKGPRTPADFQHHAEFLSSQGVVAICVDYRNGHDDGFTPIQAICDVKSAVRRLRENASDWGVDPQKIIVCGSSAGGYIAVSSIMFDHMNNEGDNQSTNHIPNALVIFGAGMDAIDIMSRRYPELLEQAREMSPYHKVKKCLPPTLWMIGTEDDLLEQNKSFVERMVAVGNDITWVTYDGMEHGFFLYGKHENRPFHETKTKIHEYLKSLALI